MRPFVSDGSGLTAPFEWKLAWELKELREAAPEEREKTAAAVLRELCRDARACTDCLAGALNAGSRGPVLILADRESPEQTAALLCVLRVLKSEGFAGAAVFALCAGGTQARRLWPCGRVLEIGACRDEREAVLAARRTIREAMRGTGAQSGT